VEQFGKRGLEAVKIGIFTEGSAIDLKMGSDTRTLWDWLDKPFTGFGNARRK